MATPLRAKKTAFNTDPHTEWVDVTPQMAEKWLGQNDGNRNIRKRDVEKYARDMLAGAWDRTAEPVKFAPSGRLLDGQHRLLAVMDSGVTVRLLVAYNVPESAQARMDTGSARTAADALGMLGIPNYALLAATARLALSVAYDRVGSFDATHDDILTWVKDHPDAAESVTFAHNVRKQVSCPTSVIAYTHLVLSDLDPAAADGFWTAVADHLASYTGDPVIALAKRLDDARRDRETLSKRALLSIIYRAWNYRRDLRALRQVKVVSAAGGLIPIPVPR